MRESEEVHARPYVSLEMKTSFLLVLVTAPLLLSQSPESLVSDLQSSEWRKRNAAASKLSSLPPKSFPLAAVLRLIQESSTHPPEDSGRSPSGGGAFGRRPRQDPLDNLYPNPRDIFGPLAFGFRAAADRTFLPSDGAQLIAPFSTELLIAHVLRRDSSRDATAALVSLLKSSRPGVGREAARALGHHGPAGVEELRKHQRDPLLVARCVEGLLLSPEPVKDLAAIVSQAQEVAIEEILLLKVIHDVDTHRSLAQRLLGSDDFNRVRLGAIRLLQEDPNISQVVATYLKSPEPAEVHLGLGMAALLTASYPEVTQSLISLLAHSDGGLATSATQVLMTFALTQEQATQARTHLHQHLSGSPSQNRRVLALQALGRLPHATPTCIEHLYAGATTGSELERRVSIDGLSAHGQLEKLGDQLTRLLGERVKQPKAWALFEGAWRALTLQDLRPLVLHMALSDPNIRIRDRNLASMFETILRVPEKDAPEVARKLAPWLLESTTVLANTATVAHVHALRKTSVAIPKEVFPPDQAERHRKARVEVLANTRLLHKLSTNASLSLIAALEPYQRFNALEHLMIDQPSAIPAILKSVGPDGPLREEAQSNQLLFRRVDLGRAQTIRLLREKDPVLQAIGVINTRHLKPPLPPELVQILTEALQSKNVEEVSEGLSTLANMSSLHSKVIPPNLLSMVQDLVEGSPESASATDLLQQWSRKPESK